MSINNDTAVQKVIGNADLPPGLDLPSGWGIPKNLVYDKVLPSGAKVRLRKLEIEDLAELGLLNEMDTFTPKAMEGNIVKKETAPTAEEQASQIARIVRMMDKVAIAALVNPKVLPKLEEGEEAIPGALYVDGIPATDKSQIFEDAVEDLGSFLSPSEGSTDDVGAVAESESTAESAE